MKTALAGFAFGEKSYIEEAIYLKKHNWDLYAEKQGYDCIFLIICLTRRCIKAT